MGTQLGDAVGPIEQGKKMLLDSKVCSCQYSIPNEGALVEAAFGTKLGEAVGPGSMNIFHCWKMNLQFSYFTF